MQCPSCSSENPDAAEVCFHCRAVLAAVTRGSVIGARYRIVALLGRGGMGAVYDAHDEVLDEDVALKILRPEVASTPEMAGRFRSEIKLARKVSHWNVCRIHEYGEDGGMQYISMERITGGTLKERLRAGALGAAEAFDIAVQIADGLAAVHKVGIVHRDLKSANVMVDAEGTAKVMDFGIAKPASTGTDGGTTGYVMGSPEYMSPEQARGRGADFRSDLYSLGIVVFEAFTGRVPFRGATPVATLMMHVEAPPPVDDPGLALPPALLPVLRAALAKDPADRGPSATAMATALRAARAASGYAPSASGESPPSAETRESSASGHQVVATRRVRVGREGRTAVFAGAFLLALLAATAVLVVTRDHASPSPHDAPSPSPAITTATPVVTSATPPSVSLSVVTTTTLAARIESPLPAPPRSVTSSAPPLETVTTTTEPPVVARATPAPAAASLPPAAAVPSLPSPPLPATPEPAPEGWLLVLAAPWADVTVDGRAVGMTPLARLRLAAGSHAVILSHPQYQPYTRKVDVRGGETTTVRLDFASDGVRR
jgi:eukaryotic-like serine/threonine-protein kinase